MGPDCAGPYRTCTDQETFARKATYCLRRVTPKYGFWVLGGGGGGLTSGQSKEVLQLLVAPATLYSADMLASSRKSRSSLRPTACTVHMYHCTLSPCGCCRRTTGGLRQLSRPPPGTWSTCGRRPTSRHSAQVRSVVSTRHTCLEL